MAWNPFDVSRVRSTVRHLQTRVRELETQLANERRVFGYRMRDLVRKNGELYHEKDNLEKRLEEKMRAAQVFSRQVSMQEHRVRELETQLANVRRVFGYRMRDLVRKNGELYHEKDNLEKRLEEKTRAAQVFSRQVSMQEHRVRELETQLANERRVFGYRMRDLVRKNGELYREKDNLEKRLEEKTRAAQVFSRQVSTQEHRVMELKRKNTELNIETDKLKNQLEHTRKAGVLFMNAADEYQEVAEKKIKVIVEELKDTRTAGMMFMYVADEYQDVVKKEFNEKVEELNDTRKACLLFMNVADEYQEEVEKELKVKVEELKETRMAGLLFMNAADDYQELVEKECKAKVEELKDTRTTGLLFMNAADEYQEVVEKEAKAKSKEFEELRAQKAKMDMRATSLESELKAAMVKKEELEADVVVRKRECEVVKKENDQLRLKVLSLKQQIGAEVKMRKMELCPLTDEKEEVENAFDVEKEETMKESKYIKRKVEEIQASKDLVEIENDKLQFEVLDVEQKHSLSEEEFKIQNMELGVLEEVKKALVATKIEIMNELGHQHGFGWG